MVNADLLKSKYVAKGFKQSDVAELLGITPQAFRAKIKNRKDFKGSEILKLIEGLDIKAEEIRPIFFNL